MTKIQTENQKLLYHLFGITTISSSTHNRISDTVLDLKYPQVIHDSKPSSFSALQSAKYNSTNNNNSGFQNAVFKHTDKEMKKLLLDNPKTKNKKQERNKNHNYYDKKIKERVHPLEYIQNKSQSLSKINPTKLSNLRSASSRIITMDNPLTINELSNLIMVPESEIIKLLFLKGIRVTINQTIGIHVATELAKEYGFEMLYEDPSNNSILHESVCVDSIDNTPRSPIITLIGSNASGKTSLIWNLMQKTEINAAKIIPTQNIQGYELNTSFTKRGSKMILLDTPGHEMFENMRNLSIKIGDMIILVIAANDGLNLPTRKIIQQVKRQSKLTIVVISKINLVTENTVKELFSAILEHNLRGVKSRADIWTYPKDMTQEQIKMLRVKLIDLSKEGSLRANPSSKVRGIILNSYLDNSKGVMASILVQEGTLKVGDFITSGNVTGRVKVIEVNNNIRVHSVEPSSIAKIWGFTAVPQIGNSVVIAKSEKEARKTAKEFISKVGILSPEQQKINRQLNNVFSNINFNDQPEQINLIIRTSTQGVQEGIIMSCAKITQPDVRLGIVSISVGKITAADIKLAIITKSIIIGFNIEGISTVRLLAKQSKVEIYNCKTIDSLIYTLEDYVNQISVNRQSKKSIGLATVNSIFVLTNCIVAGCTMRSGKITKNSLIEVIRNKEIIYQGSLTSLKQAKDDIVEAKEGEEFGMSIVNFDAWEIKDTIKVYITKL